jgi:hypothetical protein
MWRHVGATSKCPFEVSYSHALKPKEKKNKLDIAIMALADVRFMLLFNVMDSSDHDGGFMHSVMYL